MDALINKILSLQSAENKRIAVDVILKNGNLIVRSLHILSFDSLKKEIKGLTRLEEYAALREKRKPVFCKLKLNEIKELFCEDVNLQLA